MLFLISYWVMLKSDLKVTSVFLPLYSILPVQSHLQYMQVSGIVVVVAIP